MPWAEVTWLEAIVVQVEGWSGVMRQERVRMCSGQAWMGLLLGAWPAGILTTCSAMQKVISKILTVCFGDTCRGTLLC